MGSGRGFFLKAVIFLCILSILLVSCLKVFSVFAEDTHFQRIRGFYEEPENSLQAVYIGTSNAHHFLDQLTAYHGHGYTIFPYSTNNMPFCATDYVMREVRRTQPDAKFIVNINGVEEDDLDPIAIHYLVHFMEDSEIKEELIDYLSGLVGYDENDQLEFRHLWLRMRTIPITLFSYIFENGFHTELDGLKGALTNEHVSDIMDISDRYDPTEERVALPDYLVEAADRILDYCDAEAPDVLFVVVPRAETKEDASERINAMRDLIRARGYPVWDLMDRIEDIGLDLTQDFTDPKHLNTHGAIKYTNYLCEYLSGLYGFEDLRGKAAYASWDEAWEEYAGLVSPYIQYFELDGAQRDYALAAPGDLRARAAGDGRAEISWEAVAGADGYAVFRKTGEKEPWRELAAVTETAFTDATDGAGAGSSYTVVPLRRTGGGTSYGNFRYRGVKAGT